jgi:hypothetical protein
MGPRESFLGRNLKAVNLLPFYPLGLKLTSYGFSLEGAYYSLEVIAAKSFVKTYIIYRPSLSVPIGISIDLRRSTRLKKPS